MRECFLEFHSREEKKIPKIEKFEDFCVGIWEDTTDTLKRKWIKTIADKLR